MTYNWDGRLRTGSAGANSLSVKYNPMGDRVYKESTSGQTTTKRRYIVAAIDRLPVILLELDPDDSDPNAAIKKTYLYANGQVIAQHNGNYEDAIYFYLHDRLGSVREIINTSAVVVNTYTYEPFGQMFASEKQETVGNPFTFTGQYYDSEISQYYLRARQYDPQLYRFTARDPVKGELQEPLTLHAYLYCLNDPVNNTDPSGEIYMNVAQGLRAAATVYSIGLSIAAYGANMGDFNLINAGYTVTQFAGLAYLMGLSGFNGNQIVQVSRWGSPGRGAGWVMPGLPSKFNYLLSGKKWSNFGMNLPAAFDEVDTWYTTASHLSFDSGILGLVKGIFCGQAIFAP